MERAEIHARRRQRRPQDELDQGLAEGHAGLQVRTPPAARAGRRAARLEVGVAIVTGKAGPFGGRPFSLWALFGAPDWRPAVAAELPRSRLVAGLVDEMVPPRGRTSHFSIRAGERLMHTGRHHHNGRHRDRLRAVAEANW